MYYKGAEKIIHFDIKHNENNFVPRIYEEYSRRISLRRKNRVIMSNTASLNKIHCKRTRNPIFVHTFLNKSTAPYLSDAQEKSHGWVKKKTCEFSECNGAKKAAENANIPPHCHTHTRVCSITLVPFRRCTRSSFDFYIL